MQTSESEIALIRALYRVRFEKIAALLGEKYEEPTDEELEQLKIDWVPLIRAFVHYEHRLCMEREAALRAALTEQ